MKTVVLQAEEFWEAVPEPYLCIAMRVEDGYVICLCGDLRRYRLPFSYFKANAVCAPDFSKPRVKDCGQTLAFGEYQARFDLLEIEPYLLPMKDNQKH